MTSDDKDKFPREMDVGFPIRYTFADIPGEDGKEETVLFVSTDDVVRLLALAAKDFDHPPFAAMSLSLQRYFAKAKEDGEKYVAEGDTSDGKVTAITDAPEKTEDTEVPKAGWDGLSLS